MAAGAVVERHLRLLGAAHGIPAKEDSSKGSINVLRGRTPADRRVVERRPTRASCGPWATRATTRPTAGLSASTPGPHSAFCASSSASCGTPSLWHLRSGPDVRQLARRWPQLARANPRCRPQRTSDPAGHSGWVTSDSGTTPRRLPHLAEPRVLRRGRGASRTSRGSIPWRHDARMTCPGVTSPPAAGHFAGLHDVPRLSLKSDSIAKCL